MSEARRILTVTHPAYEVVVFMLPDGSADACVMHNGTETTRMRIESPPTGQRIVVNRLPSGVVEVQYRDSE